MWIFTNVAVPVAPKYLCLSIEDILDEVSGLTVESPDESLVEGPRLTQQSPGDHQEDKTCTGAGQKVRYDLQRYNFGLVCTYNKPTQTHIVHVTEQVINSLVLQRIEYHTHPVRCIVADRDKDQQLWCRLPSVCV